MGKRESVPNRQYTDEFKVEAVRLAESIGGNQAAKRLGIPDSSLWNWIRLSRAGKLKADVARSAGKAVGRGSRGGERSVAPGIGQHQARSGNRKKSGGVFREGVAVKYAWIEEQSDLLQRDADVPPAWGVAQGVLPVDYASAERALDSQYDARCASGRNSCGQPAQLRRAANRARASRARCSGGQERVRNSLKRQDLRPVYKRAYRVTTDSAHQKPIAPNVLDRRVEGWRVNQAWVAD